MHLKLNLSLKQLSRHAQYAVLKTTKDVDWSQWIHDLNAGSPKNGPYIFGLKDEGENRVVIVSANPLLDKLFSKNICVPGFVCVDGIATHMRKYTLLRLGVQDVSHVYHDVAYIIISGREGEKEMTMALMMMDEILEERSKTLKLPKPSFSKIMSDGASGFRNAFQARASKGEVTIAMCYFHMIKAIREHFALLPSGMHDGNQVMEDIDSGLS